VCAHLTILVVDDDAAIRAMLRRILEPAGYQILEAADGLAALEQIEAERPDLILLDMIMPRLDGWGVLRALQQSPPLATIPVVLVSGHILAEDSQVRAWGAVAQLPKPFRPTALRALVAELLTPGEQPVYSTQSTGRD